jgi:hypothetical protein
VQRAMDPIRDRADVVVRFTFAQRDVNQRHSNLIRSVIDSLLLPLFDSAGFTRDSTCSAINL